jgi:hypothetical protein
MFSISSSTVLAGVLVQEDQQEEVDRREAPPEGLMCSTMPLGNGHCRRAR